jgi:adenylate kinase family enzyme
MRRIAVVGTSGSGKTTLGRALAGRTGLPHVELDALHWGADWTPVDPDVFRAEVEAVVARPEWIVDGNYSAVRDLVWGRATTLVWLDLPFHTVFRRAVARTLRRIVTRETLYGGNRESLRNALDPEWIPWWVIRTWRRRRREYGARLARPEFAHLEAVVLRRPAEVEAFLRRAGARGA